jgi:tRNA pseudouridine32 synthase / 23S rRNA pseudouridine746 synthase
MTSVTGPAKGAASDCNILYRDEHLVVIDKPPGLLSVPGRGPDKQDCAASRLQALVSDARVVHRLDCATSGVMLFAIGADMQRALSRLFHDREVHKEYIALVEGRVGDETGTIDIALRGDPATRPVQVIDELNGKPALTHWQLISRTKAASRLRLLPQTGRTHQLRVHCMALGHPIIGDRLYNKNACGETGERMMLHAASLRFTHPASGADMLFEAACEF